MKKILIIAWLIACTFSCFAQSRNLPTPVASSITAFKYSALDIPLVFEGAIPDMVKAEVWEINRTEGQKVASIVPVVIKSGLTATVKLTKEQVGKLKKNTAIFVMLGKDYKIGIRIKTTASYGVSGPSPISVTVPGIGQVKVNLIGDAGRVINTYLHKNTMQEMRSMSASEKADINNNIYKGVLLHGYYAYGDTPGAIAYYKSTTPESDDQGSIIQVDPTLKLEHKFSVCDVSYYGLQPEINTISVVDRNTLVINNAIKGALKVTITNPGKYWCRVNRGGEGGSYYRYEDPLGTIWWQAGDGDGQPGGINMLSNRTLEMADGVTLKMRGTFMHAYNFITIWNKENVTIKGGNIVGDFDLDPTLNEHYFPGRVPTFDDGEWGYGICLQGSNNVTIENVSISKMFADGINIAPDHLHNHKVNSNITMRNIKSHHNRRQGMSINGGIKMSFYNCEFSDTKGRDPQCGVDLESDYPNFAIQYKDIFFFDCKFINNLIGARTVQRVGEKKAVVKFSNCVFEGNTQLDYDSYNGTGVEFNGCRFDYQASRLYSLNFFGASHQNFNNCELGNAIIVTQRRIGLVGDEYIKSENITFERCKAPQIKVEGGQLEFFNLSNSRNVKVKDCDFKSIALQDDRTLFVANGAENIEIISNSFRELGRVFAIKNTNGFKFNGNTVINTLSVTGKFEGNVKHFEMCNNEISGNSYYTPNAFAPVLLLAGKGTAYGKINDNVVYDDPIFTPLGSRNGSGTGLYREYNSPSDNIVISNNKIIGFTNANAFQFNIASTNLSVRYLNEPAGHVYKGVVNKSASIPVVTNPNANTQKPRKP